MRHTDIVRDILSVHDSRGDDSRVWGSSVSGQLTSRLAYDLPRASHPRVDSESLDHIFALCPFTRNLLGKVSGFFDLNMYNDIGFLDVFLQATSFHFGKQLRCYRGLLSSLPYGLFGMPVIGRFLMRFDL
ncbi:hypothetical protein ACS0TY_006666 [Phlomoides rotata]